MSKKVRVGRIVRAHGMKGEVKVLPYLRNDLIFKDLPRLFWRKEGEFVPIDVESVRQAPGGGFLIKFKSVSSREQAEALSKTEIWADLSDFPPLEEGEYYYYQLVGLDVYREDWTILGKVKGIMPIGPYDLLEINPPHGKSFYLPMIEDVILEINLEKGYILARPPEGLLD